MKVEELRQCYWLKDIHNKEHYHYHNINIDNDISVLC